jgi:hypothetical protein
MVSASLILLILAAVVALWPWVVVVPLVALGLWMALSLLIRAYRLYVLGKRDRSAFPPV